MSDWITGFIRALGAPGIGLLMFTENVFPPLPSEFIMPLAGYMCAQGQLNLVTVIFAGSLGSLLGATFWYWVGVKAGADKVRHWINTHGVWLGLYEGDLRRSDRFFRRHGRAAVFFGRLVPLVRTFISVPAGMSGMSFLSFLLFSTVGTVIWTAALALGGYWLGQQFPMISNYLGPITWAIIVGAIVTYLVRVYRIKKRQNATQNSA
jgi:membrane protein DedA with SNARE-associated domain